MKGKALLGIGMLFLGMLIGALASVLGQCILGSSSKTSSQGTCEAADANPESSSLHLVTYP